MKCEILSHFKEPLWKSDRRYIVLQGGAGSGKTHAIIQRICNLFLTREDTRIAVVRSTMPALKRSVYMGSPSVVEQLGAWNIPITDWLNKTETRVVNPLNGSVIDFIGLDDAEKIKSMNINTLFIEEATELTAEKWRQLDTRMRRPNKYGPNQMYIAYNPISYNNWVVQTFVANPDPVIAENSYVHFSNFTQNPYVSLAEAKTWLANATHNEEYYRTYILGIPGTPQGQIYTNFKYLPADMWDEEVWKQKPYYGIDWGYIDPMVLVEVRDYNGRMYVRCLYYKTEHTVDDLIQFMDDIGISHSAPIYCDHENAEARAKLLKHSYLAMKAMKSLYTGIMHVKSQDIVIDNGTPEGEAVMLEAQSYLWERDKDNPDEFVEKPIDKYNHSLDAIRYAIYTKYMKEMEFSTGKLSFSDFNDKLDGLVGPNISKKAV